MVEEVLEVEVFPEKYTTDFEKKTTENDEILKRYPERPRLKRVPFGYRKKEGDHKTLVPILPVVKLLDKALDLLDQGDPLVPTSDWLNSEIQKLELEEDCSISFMGLRSIWRAQRPQAPSHIARKKLEKSRRRKKPLTRQQILEKNRKKKIAEEKRKITYAKKRINKLADEIEIISSVKDNSVVEIDYNILDYSTLPAEAKEEKPVFEPNPGPQTEFLMAPQLEVLYGGSAGGGKSYALLADPVRHFGNKHFNGLLVRRTTEELRELIWKSKELYPQAYPDAKFSEQKSEWRFPSGAKLWMSYLDRDDDVLKYQGQAFTWIGFDELTQYPTPFPWTYLRSRLRSADPEMSKNLAMRATTNPGGPGHGWVKRMFIDPSPANIPFWATDIETGKTLVYPDSHPKAGQPVFRRRFIPARLYDNPFLAADGIYEANLLSLPESERRRLLEGDWSVADGAAFGEFREHIHVCTPFEIPSTWRRFRSCDYGYSSFSAVHWYAIAPEGTLYVYRELYVSKMEGEDLAREVLRLERGERIDYGVLDSSLWSKRGDPGPSIAERMNQVGCRWKPSDRSPGSRVAGKNRLHSLLKVDSLNEKPGIIFFNTCRQIIADLPVIPQDPKGGEEIDPRFASDHAYDSIRYGIMSRPAPNSPWQALDRHQASVSSLPSDGLFGY